MENKIITVTLQCQDETREQQTTEARLMKLTHGVSAEPCGGEAPRGEVTEFEFCLIVFLLTLQIQFTNSTYQLTQTPGADGRTHPPRRGSRRAAGLRAKQGATDEGSNQTHQMKWQLTSKAFSDRLAAKSELWSVALGAVLRILDHLLRRWLTQGQQPKSQPEPNSQRSPQSSDPSQTSSGQDSSTREQ